MGMGISRASSMINMQQMQGVQSPPKLKKAKSAPTLSGVKKSGGPSPLAKQKSTQSMLKTQSNAKLFGPQMLKKAHSSIDTTPPQTLESNSEEIDDFPILQNKGGNSKVKRGSIIGRDVSVEASSRRGKFANVGSGDYGEAADVATESIGRTGDYMGAGTLNGDTKGLSQSGGHNYSAGGLGTIANGIGLYGSVKTCVKADKLSGQINKIKSEISTKKKKALELRQRASKLQDGVGKEQLLNEAKNIDNDVRSLTKQLKTVRQEYRLAVFDSTTGVVGSLNGLANAGAAIATDVGTELGKEAVKDGASIAAGVTQAIGGGIGIVTGTVGMVIDGKGAIEAHGRIKKVDNHQSKIQSKRDGIAVREKALANLRKANNPDDAGAIQRLEGEVKQLKAEVQAAEKLDNVGEQFKSNAKKSRLVKALGFLKNALSVVAGVGMLVLAVSACAAAAISPIGWVAAGVALCVGIGVAAYKITSTKSQAKEINKTTDAVNDKAKDVDELEEQVEGLSDDLDTARDELSVLKEAEPPDLDAISAKEMQVASLDKALTAQGIELELAKAELGELTSKLETISPDAGAKRVIAQLKSGNPEEAKAAEDFCNDVLGLKADDLKGEEGLEILKNKLTLFT